MAVNKWTRIAWRHAHGCLYVQVDGVDLPAREDLVLTWMTAYKTKPDSFGARRLAVAILAITFGDDFAREHWKAFLADCLNDVLARQPQTGVLPRERVLQWHRAAFDEFDRLEREAIQMEGQS